MRHQQYTLTPRHVHGHATHLIQKHVRLRDHGPKSRAWALWTVLFYAASRITSLAAACAALREAPSDTASHDALLATLPNNAELQRRLNRALQGDLPHALRQRRQPLAVDLTLLPYHGQPQEDLSEIFRSQAKSGTSHFHAYATAYVLRKGQRFTVALTSVGRSEPLPDLLKRLLRTAAQARVRPRYLLLDRGFCSVEVIRYLQAARHAWLMPLTLRGRKPEHPQGVSGSRRFATWKRSGWGQHTLTNADGRRATFRVCVKCRNRRGERGRHGREALV
jgi:Transposase DDE domain